MGIIGNAINAEDKERYREGREWQIWVEIGKMR